MSRKDVLERIKKKIDKKEEEHKQILEKAKSVSNELETLKKEMAAMELEEINISLAKNGLILNEVLEALESGSIDILKTKIELNQLKNKNIQ